MQKTILASYRHAGLGGNHPLIAKFLMIVATVLCLGIPINELYRLLLLVFFLILIICLPGKNPSRKGQWLSIAVITLSIFSTHLLPRASIEEGYNVFLPRGPATEVEMAPSGIPAAVQAIFLKTFNASYPQRQECTASVIGEWCIQPGASRSANTAFVQSLDNIFSSPKYSRTVDTIDFSGLRGLRAGFANEADYNWWQGSMRRETMPFYVMYEINPRIIGSRLCWKGDVIWENHQGSYVYLPSGGSHCRTLAAADIGKHVYGIGIDPKRPLTMRLELNRVLAASQLGIQIIPVLAILLFLFALLDFTSWRKALPVVLWTLFGFICAYHYAPTLFSGYTIFAGGDDGLTHEAFGRGILRAILAGDFHLALMGGESVYYFMPGLRYFKAMGLVLFGETNLGYLAVVSLLPFLSVSLAQKLLPRNWAVFFALLLTIFLGQFYKVAGEGFAEPLGYALFMISLLVIFDEDISTSRKFIAYGILAISIFVRPNLSIPALIFIAIDFIQNIKRDTFRSFAVSLLGFCPVLVMPLHNYYFGHKLVLFTSSATISVNMRVPPAVYREAFTHMMQGIYDQQALALVFKHLQEIRSSLLLVVLMFGMSWWANRKQCAPAFANILFAISLGMFLPFLFYVATGRYHMFAWLCAYLVLASYAFALYQGRKHRPAPFERTA